MGDSQEVQINNLVGFLSRYAPSSLHELRRQFPNSIVLQDGQTLGTLNEASLVRVELSLEALTAMASLAEIAIDGLYRRMRITNFVELIGQLVALFGSCGTLVAIFSNAAQLTQTVGTMIALIGSAIALCIKAARRDIVGVENGLMQIYMDLVNANGQAMVLRQQLLPYQRAVDDFENHQELNQRIYESDELAGRLYQLLKRSGQPIPPNHAVRSSR